MSGVDADACPHCARHRAEAASLRSLIATYVASARAWVRAAYNSEEGRVARAEMSRAYEGMERVAGTS